MRKSRVLLANRPRLMREVIRELIQSQEDMEVVGEVLDPLDLLVEVREKEADVVIAALEDSEEPGVCSHLLGEYPNLIILGLGIESKSAFVEQLHPGRLEIVEPTGSDILTALRESIRAGKGEDRDPLELREKPPAEPFCELRRASLKGCESLILTNTSIRRHSA